MEFGIGDVVRVKSGKFIGAIGIIREKHKSLWCSEIIYEIEVPESVIINQTILKTGVMINSIKMEHKDLELVLNEYMCPTKEDEQLLTTLINQRANNKYNTWEVRIRPSTNDKDATYAELYINGRFEGAECVNRYHTDKYSAGIACVEVCKKLFGVKNTEEKSEETPTPKYYTGNVICTGDTQFFTKGKIYKVENGTICSDTSGDFIRFKSLEELNTFSLFKNANFIEFVE